MFDRADLILFNVPGWDPLARRLPHPDGERE
jgi:hypothetical protein